MLPETEVLKFRWAAEFSNTFGTAISREISGETYICASTGRLLQLFCRNLQKRSRIFCQNYWTIKFKAEGIEKRSEESQHADDTSIDWRRTARIRDGGLLGRISRCRRNCLTGGGRREKRGLGSGGIVRSVRSKCYNNAIEWDTWAILERCMSITIRSSRRILDRRIGGGRSDLDRPLGFATW